MRDVSEQAGISGSSWSAGVTVVDINKDGLLDVYVCVGGPSKDKNDLKNELYINQGDGTFVESAEEYGIAGFHRS